MPEFLKVNTGVAQLAIWRIEEDEEALKRIIGGDSFPVLMQFQDPKRRLEWLATRCCLKMLGITDSIIYAPNRRPYLSNDRQHISISHSYPYVAVIASTDFYVGLDIESLDRPYAKIADKYLTLGEIAWIDVHDDDRMALVWSAKEAFYKLPGMEGLNSFVDITMLPIARVRKQGLLRMRVRMDGRVQSFSMEYAFLEGYTVTWVACNPNMLAGLTQA